jgi:hypothetical protein
VGQLTPDGREHTARACWTPQVTELPLQVRRESERVDPVGVVLYPYWVVDVDVHVTAFLLPGIVRHWQAAVDGVTGRPYTLQHQPAVTVRDPARRDARATRVLIVTPFALQRADLDRGYLERALQHYASRRFRSWRNVRVAIGDATPVYKELRVFDVAFRNGASALLALDTITGDYGVAPAGVLAGIEETDGHAGEEGTRDRTDAPMGALDVAGDR